MVVMIYVAVIIITAVVIIMKVVVIIIKAGDNTSSTNCPHDICLLFQVRRSAVLVVGFI